MIALLALLAQVPVAAAALPPEVVAMADEPMSSSARLGLARSLLGRPGWEEAGIEALARLVDDPEVGTAARQALVDLLSVVDARAGWQDIYARLLVSRSFRGREWVELRYAEVRLANPASRKAATAELDRLLATADGPLAQRIGRAFLRNGDAPRATAAFARDMSAEGRELEVLAALAAGNTARAKGVLLPASRPASLGRALDDPTPSNRASALAASGYSTAARQVLAAAPAAEVGRQLADLCRAEGALAEATIALQAYRRAHPEDEAAALALADVFVARQRYADAYALLRGRAPMAAAALEPLVAYRKAWESTSKRGLDARLEEAWRAAPGDPFVAREWAKARLKARHPEEALPILGQLLDLTPGDADALGVYNLAAIATSASRSAVRRDLAAAAVARSPAERAERLRTAADLMSLDGEEVKATGNTEGAVDVYLVSLLVAPPAVDDLMGAAGLLWQAQYLGGAAALYEEALRRQPGNATALLSTVRLLLQAGREVDALQVLENSEIRDVRVRLLHTSVVNAVRAREARAASRAGDLDVALALWKELAAEYPEEAEFLHGLADTLAGLGEYEEALVQYDRAVALDKRDAWAVIGQANCLLALGRPEAARARLADAYPAGVDAVADAERPRVLARAWRATAAREQAGGAVLDAFAAWRAAFELDPDVWSMVGLASLYQLRDQPEVALAFFDEVLALQPELDEARLGRAMALESLGRWDDALVAADALRHPEAPEELLARRAELVRRVIVQRSEYVRRSGDAASAVASIRATIEAEGDSADLWTALAASSIDARDCATAFDATARALSLNPRSRWALRTTVRVGASCHQAEEVAGLVRAADVAAGAGFAAVELRAAEFERHVQCAERLDALGRSVEAQEALDTAGAIRDLTDDERARLGGAWLGLGKPTEALAAFDRTLAHNPRHVPAIVGKAGALRSLDRLAATETFLEASWVEGRDPRVGLQLVQTLLYRGKHREAEERLADVKTATLPPEEEPSRAPLLEPLPILPLPSGRVPGPRTWPPSPPVDLYPRWLVLQIEAVDIDLARERGVFVMAGGGAFSKLGQPGQQQLDGWYVPVEVVFPPIGQLRPSADVVVVGLDDGVDQAVGAAPSVALASAPHRRFFASGRVGTSPIGFADTNLLWFGHARLGVTPSLAVGVQTARTPVSDSLLSWAGKSTNAVGTDAIYGFVSQFWLGTYASWTPGAHRLGALVRGGFSEGYGVPPNAYVEGVGWASTPIGSSESGLRVGTNLVAMHHDRQEDGFSPNEGGYFSPPLLLLGVVGLDGEARFASGRGAVCGSLGVGPQYLDGDDTLWFGTGLSGSGRVGAGASWKLAPRWSVGVDARAQGSLVVAADGTPTLWNQQSVLGHLTWGLAPQGPPAPSLTTVASRGSVLPDASTLCRVE
jgi:tetratricopeptide (TPR) repeat protein